MEAAQLHAAGFMRNTNNQSVKLQFVARRTVGDCSFAHRAPANGPRKVTEVSQASIRASRAGFFLWLDGSHTQAPQPYPNPTRPKPERSCLHSCDLQESSLRRELVFQEKIFQHGKRINRKRQWTRKKDRNH